LILKFSSDLRNYIGTSSQSKKTSSFNTHKLILCLGTLFLFGCGGSSSSDPVEEVPVSVPVVVEPIINSVSFLVMDNPELDADITLQVAGKQITARVPVEVDLSDLVARVDYTGDSLMLDDEIQVSASSRNDFKQIRTYTVVMDDQRSASYTLDITSFTGLPVIYLDTAGEGEIDSKEDYIEGGFSVKGGRHFSDQDRLAMEIRGRGNSTWFLQMAILGRILRQNHAAQYGGF
jgi:hypothetical protein